MSPESVVVGSRKVANSIPGCEVEDILERLDDLPAVKVSMSNHAELRGRRKRFTDHFISFSGVAPLYSTRSSVQSFIEELIHTAFDLTSSCDLPKLQVRRVRQMAHAERGCEVPRRRSVIQHRGLLFYGWRSRCREAADGKKDREKDDFDFHTDRRCSG